MRGRGRRRGKVERDMVREEKRGVGGVQMERKWTERPANLAGRGLQHQR